MDSWVQLPEKNSIKLGEFQLDIDETQTMFANILLQITDAYPSLVLSKAESSFCQN